jgi:hypothetical protein
VLGRGYYAKGPVPDAPGRLCQWRAVLVGPLGVRATEKIQKVAGCCGSRYSQLVAAATRHDSDGPPTIRVARPTP